MKQHKGVTTGRRKRRATTALVGGLAALALTACGQTPGPAPEGPEFDFTGKDVGAMADFGVGTPFKATEPLVLPLFYRDHEGYPLKDDWLFLTELQKNQNITFDIQSAPRSDWDQAKSTVIAGGNAPDIITVTYPGQETQFVSGGALLPVSDFTQYMPNFTDKVAKWGLQTDVDNLRQADGKFYLLPGVGEILRPQYTYAVRTDIWNELGLSLQPKDFNEFADQLRTVKAAHPELNYVISDRWNDPDPLGATLNFASPNFGTRAGWGYGNGAFWTGSEFEYIGASDAYKSLIEYYAGLVTEGLMDPASISQTDDDAKAKFANGESAVVASNDQELVTAYRQTITELGKPYEVGLIRVPAGPAGDLLQAGGRLDGLPGIMLSSKAAEKPHFKALLQFVDWLYYSDEGLEFAKWGVEGQTFERQGDRRVMINYDRNGLNPGADPLNVETGFANGAFMLNEGSTKDLMLSMLAPETVEFVDSMVGTKTQIDTPPPAPLTEIELEQASLWATALKDHVWLNTAQFIVGQRPLSEWEAYVAELEGKSMQQYLDMLNAAQKRQAEIIG